MNKTDIAFIKNFVQSREFEILQRVGSMMNDEWKKEVATGETEFQYLKSSLERDGKILGIASYLKRLTEIANEND